MNILFVCKHNVFRSKVAEAYFNKINKNANIKVKSAGIILGIGINKKQKQGVKAQREVANEFGIKVKGKPKPLTVELLRKQDLIIITADNIPSSIFNNAEYIKKLVVWKIPDEQFANKENIKRAIKLIIIKANKLIKQLENIK